MTQPFTAASFIELTGGFIFSPQARYRVAENHLLSSRCSPTYFAQSDNPPLQQSSWLSSRANCRVFIHRRTGSHDPNLYKGFKALLLQILDFLRGPNKSANLMSVVFVRLFWTSSSPACFINPWRGTVIIVAAIFMESDSVLNRMYKFNGRRLYWVFFLSFTEEHFNNE